MVSIRDFNGFSMCDVFLFFFLYMERKKKSIAILQKGETVTCICGGCFGNGQKQGNKMLFFEHPTIPTVTSTVQD